MDKNSKLFISSIILSILLRLASGQINTCAPNRNGTAPFIGDCQHFVNCENGVQVGNPERCPNSGGNQLHFDYQYATCVNIRVVTCFPGDQVDCESQEYISNIPEPNNCRQFKHCPGEILQTCPQGQLYDYFRNGCIFMNEESVRCYPGSNITAIR